jgi:hypothetical protein
VHRYDPAQPCHLLGQPTGIRYEPDGRPYVIGPKNDGKTPNRRLYVDEITAVVKAEQTIRDLWRAA